MEDTESLDTRTTTSADETDTNLGDNPTRDTLAEGLLGFLKPTVDALDERLRAVRISQVELQQQLDTLNEDLKKLSQGLNNLPDLEIYVKKFIACKHKITVVINLLQSSQDRLNEIRRMGGGIRSALQPAPEVIQPEPGPSGIASTDGGIN